MKALVFSLRLLRREWRAGELRLPAMALIIAVASVTAVGFFTDRVRGAMGHQASELLAADLVIVSSSRPEKTWTARARTAGLSVTHTLTFPSMVLADGKTQLVEIKAVAPGYPLRGQLRTASKPFASDTATTAIPTTGSVWPDPRMMSALGLSIGDRIQVGSATLRVDRVLAYEPDRGGDLFSIAPRLLMNLADIPATSLIQPGSRIAYRLLLAGESAKLRAFRAWIESRLGATARLLGVRDARPEMRLALERAEQFLGLAALVSVVLAGLAIAISARRFAHRHLNPSAVMRCLGATQAFIVRVQVLQMLWLALGASLVGAAFGYLAQEGLAALITGLVADVLPPPSAAPLFTALATGLITLLGFALPPILRLKEVSPARVLRRDLGSLPPRSITVYIAAVGAMAALILWQIRDVVLAAYVLAGSLATVAALATVAFGMVKAVGPLRRRVGVAWRFGMANLSRRAAASVAQLLAFGLGIMVMLLLAIVRTDLLDDWRRSLPADAPNYFAINVQKQQLAELRSFFTEHGLPPPRLYPMVRARLTAINSIDVDLESVPNPRARHHLQREANLSWAARPQADNRIVSGQWWQPGDDGKPYLSMEQGLAKTLGIKIGDRLRYAVAGEPLEVTVTNLRSVEWDSFQVNFYVVTPPGVLEGYPATYITSFRLTPAKTGLLIPLIKRFPNFTVIDVSALMQKVRQIMDRVALAVEYVFLFTLLAGTIVLWAAIQATQDERMHEGAILRTLGASRRQLLFGIGAEFVTLGTLAGILAALAANAVGFVLAREVLHLDYPLNPWLWITGLLGGAIGIGVAGTLGARAVVTSPPLHILRRR